MKLFSCQNLVLGYDSKIVSESINFSISKGDYLCVIGDNGSGKSTLIKTLLKLIPPIKGEIILNKGFSRKEIGYLPQQTDIQRDFPASVYEIVISGFLNSCGLRPFYSKHEKRIADENMEKLGIINFKRSCYRELSGGQQQKVLLARALCSTKTILLLDEPTAGLDPAASEDFYEIIKKLNNIDKISVMMITHDVESALKYSSHILRLGSSEVLFDRTECFIKNNKFNKEGDNYDRNN